MRRVVVTGMGALTPVGNTVKETWDALVAGKNGIGPITQFDASDLKVRMAAEVKGFDPLAFMDKGEARKFDPFIRYMVAAAEECMADADIVGNIAPERIGTYLSSGIGGIQTTVKESERMVGGAARLTPFLIPMMIVNMGAGVVAMKYGLKGPTMPVVTACATSTNAIGEAVRTIRHGYADAILAGGSEASVCRIAVMGFIACQALTQNEDVNEASIPFDRRRSGFVIGEGAACVMLEEYEHAKARGAHIYAEVAGYGNTCDAHHFTAPDPEAAGVTRAVQDATAEAGFAVDENTYVNCHGTSTELNDKIETMGYHKAFGEKASLPAYSSTKSMTGHMLGAAGATEAIAAILTMQNGTAPPTINYREKDPECDLFYTPNQAEKRPFDKAVSTSLGFGGHNACLAFKKL